MDKIRVLLADDHTMMREGIRSLLSLHDDIEVVGEACDGREVITKANELLPDVVVMDIAMPQLDGFEAARRLRKHQTKTHILILTQFEDKEHVLASLKSGATGCLSKKAVASDLVSAIRAVHRGESFLHPSVARHVIDEYVHHTSADEEPYERLTDREREVLKLLAEGRTNREIADTLVISVKTVLAHRAKIMEKLDIHNRTDLVKYALRKGLISVDE